MTTSEKTNTPSAPEVEGVDEDQSDALHRRSAVTAVTAVTEPHGTGVDNITALPHWLKYAQAAAYTGYSIRYLRNLVSADAIPVYGSPRSRRFRRDVLDHFLTNRDAAMRKFRLERQAHHGD